MKFKYYLRGAGVGVIVATVILSIAFLFQDNMSDAEVIRRAMELGMTMEESTQGTLADIVPQGVTKVDMDTAADDLTQNGPTDGQGSDDAGTPGEQNGDTGTPDGSGTSDPLGQGGDDDTPDTSDTHGVPDGTDGSGQGQADKPDDTDDDPSHTPDPQGQGGDDPSQSTAPDNDNNNNEKDTVKIEVVGGDVSRVVSEKLQQAGLIDNAEEFNNYMGANGYANNIQPGTFKIKKGSSFKQIADIITSR